MASKRQCIISKLAEEDIQEAIDYIANVLHDSKAAFDLYDKIFDKIEQLSIFPNCGEVYDNIFVEKGKYRKDLVNNYIIYYTFENDTISVIRVAHHLRNTKLF